MSKRLRVPIGALLAGIFFSTLTAPSYVYAEEPPAKMELTSPAFTPGGTIPDEFTCSGADVSPPLDWTGVPAAAKSLAMIVDDPDAPTKTWVHWVIYDLPAAQHGLVRNVAKTASVAGGGVQGTNDFRRYGYGGPCPPPGPAHHYRFRLYALDSKLDLQLGASAAELESAIKGHVLAGTELVGTFGR